ncbi:TatD family hydrolase [Weissella tructae]|uniref:Hydrolase, TatD family n=1 Tax=Weissella ceti TaxID=759620 RepID=A0A088GJN8_9LACO|nr:MULTISPECIES: TatD family hydrolase [Weissella]AIM62477.1 Hydrolase, TatD family [Weissella ceti]AIM63814.1 Hydrolase, TatD family [Weissella ceti]ELA07951.1 Mg-dependent DNase [Weissella ceti NC36]QVV91549.1 TatD family hydrolase [Weissella tructae]
MATYDPTNRPADAYDTHTHLNEDVFWDDVATYWDRAREFRVVEMNNIGYDREGNERAIEMAHKFEGMHAIIGWQPGDVAGFTDEEFDILKVQAQDEVVVGLGEMGLDYYWESNPSPEVQKAAFSRQLALAKELNLPVTIHARDASDDVYELLKSHNVSDFGGVMHSFTGDAEEAKRFLDLGMYISFSGMVTFKNAKEIKEALQVVPLDRLLVETDAPFLAPTPMRGKQNEPMFVRHTIESVAEQLGMTYNELAEITKNNAHRLWLDK